MKYLYFLSQRVLYVKKKIKLEYLLTALFFSRNESVLGKLPQILYYYLLIGKSNSEHTFLYKLRIFFINEQ